MKRQLIVLSIALLVNGALHAQAVAPGVSQDHQAMLKQMEAAQAGASQPGDEDLSCDQLQEQFATVTSDPALQAQVQEVGAAAQKDMAATEAAQGQIAAQTAGTVASTMVPGASMAAMLAAAADAEAKKAQAAERIQSMALQAQDLTALMPTLMRGERLMQLAAAKKCEWAAGIDPATAPVKPDE